MTRLIWTKFILLPGGTKIEYKYQPPEDVQRLQFSLILAASYHVGGYWTDEVDRQWDQPLDTRRDELLPVLPQGLGFGPILMGLRQVTQPTSSEGWTQHCSRSEEIASTSYLDRRRQLTKGG